MERQTLRRLAPNGAIVFTIRTYVAPLLELSALREFRENLLRGVESAPEEMQCYKG